VGKPTEVFLIDANAEPVSVEKAKRPYAFTVSGQILAASGEVEMWSWINKLNSCVPWFESKREEVSTPESLTPGVVLPTATPVKKKNLFHKIFSGDDSSPRGVSPHRANRKTVQFSVRVTPDSTPSPSLTRTKHSGSGGSPSSLQIPEAAAFSGNKSDGHSEGRVFGVSIASIVSEDPAEDDPNLPAVLSVLVKDIRARGLKEEGILRVPGGHSEIEAIRKVFEQTQHARDVDLKPYDILSVGGAMKAWLREVPQGFLSCDSARQQQIVDWTQSHPTLDEESGKEYRSMLETAMPPCHLSVLKLLGQLVLDITAHEDLNKMTTDNVLTCLLPSMKIPTVIFIRLVQNLKVVFP